MKLNELLPEDILLHNEEALFISSPIGNILDESDNRVHIEPMNLWEMANLGTSTTGLDGLIVWVSGGGEKLKHGPRIKVVRGTKFKPELSSTIPLTGIPRIIGNADLSQEEFAKLISWIEKNRQTILKYWNDEIHTAEMVNMIKKV